MDTIEKYRGDKFYVVMAGERPPEHIMKKREENMERKVNDPDDPLTGFGDIGPARGEHYLGDEPPVDGWVEFYDPDKLESGEPYKHGRFPFRSVKKGDSPWFARPDGEKRDRHPIWKWQNPDEDPHENLTLKPSIGKRNSDGEIVFHCWIENGEIRWV